MPARREPWKAGRRQWFIKYSHDPWPYGKPDPLSWPAIVPLKMTITLHNAGEPEYDLPGQPCRPLSLVSHIAYHPVYSECLFY